MGLAWLRRGFMADTEQFTLKFDGDALKDGTIDARELAPSLLALADLFDVAIRRMGTGDAKVNLRIHSEFRSGSFGVELAPILSAYGQFVEIFTSPGITAVSSLMSILGISGFGLFQLIKRSNGRKVKRVVTIERTERVRVEFEGDGEPVEVDRIAAELFDKSEARRAAEKVVEPLKNDGIDSVEFVRNQQTMFKADKSDLDSFRVPDDIADEVVSDSERIVRIVSPSFKEGNKWRVNDGAETIHASIRDDAFLRRVRSREELFGNNDYLRVTLRTRQWYEGDVLRAEHEIVEVKEHIGRPDQGRLELEGEEP